MVFLVELTILPKKLNSSWWKVCLTKTWLCLSVPHGNIIILSWTLIQYRFFKVKVIRVELTFLICIIDRFGIAGTYVDIFPYMVAKIIISSVDKLIIMAKFSAVSMNPDVGHQHILYPSVPSPLHLYLCPVWVCTSRTCRTRSFCHIRPSLLCNHPQSWLRACPYL